MIVELLLELPDYSGRGDYQGRSLRGCVVVGNSMLNVSGLDRLYSTKHKWRTAYFFDVPKPLKPIICIMSLSSFTMVVSLTSSTRACSLRAFF